MDFIGFQEIQEANENLKAIQYKGGFLNYYDSADQLEVQLEDFLQLLTHCHVDNSFLTLAFKDKEDTEGPKEIIWVSKCHLATKVVFLKLILI
ncbi:hypothetical protein scyTo_0015093 [Scyliorhinus torazame]|uniref:Uncharacterized protein n=1 Tax=Scyliorhinus torazame TaxID=75743 RepID=A0A401P1Z9_SCYTO|nr:hypothetical protein [Scyliorhinus torazame]